MVNVHSVQVVVAVVCMVCKCTAVCHVVLGYIIIESVDSISRDERDVPLTQYITNA